MAADASADLAAHIAELERRDTLVAFELDRAVELAERAGAIRSRATEVRDALARLPAELDALGERQTEAQSAAEELRVALQRAEVRRGELESARRQRRDELERARSEEATAREALSDALVHLERLAAVGAQLRADQASLEAETGPLGEAAADVADALQAIGRLAEGARGDPGVDLEALEEWGAQVRSALFVVRGTLESERERIVIEANALGSSVLGEELGSSSVAVVRRRVDEALGG